MSDVPATPEVGLYQGIRDILLSARTQVRQTVNTAMVQTYWQIGRLIVEDEQGGEKRAEYGKRVLPELAKRLSAEFGKGFSAQSLWNYRQFYLEFPILSTAWRELSWSHFKMLMRVKNSQARAWYANETATQMRIQKKLNASSQANLFSAEEQVVHQDLASTNLDDVKAYWLAQLRDNPVRYDETRLADMLEKTGWLTRDFQDAFQELLAEKKVENLDGSARRTKHPIHFEKGEQLRRLT